MQQVLDRDDLSFDARTISSVKKRPTRHKTSLDLAGNKS
jgi:hypothetical protein